MNRIRRGLVVDGDKLKCMGIHGGMGIHMGMHGGIVHVRDVWESVER
jgi:hypothetical protein